MWINADTLVNYEYHFQIRNDFSNTSLPEYLTDEFLTTINIFSVVPIRQPEYDWMTQNCVKGSPELVNGTWYETWVVTEATPEEVAQRKTQCQQQNKTKAEDMLKASDWSQYPDVTNQLNIPHLVNSEEWVIYRAAVRAIAINPPISVTEWPTKPEEIWSV